MSRRTNRRAELDTVAKRELLAAIGACRNAITESHRRLRPACATYQVGLSVTESIDDLAEVLTGSREHFWAKPHAPSGSVSE